MLATTYCSASASDAATLTTLPLHTITAPLLLQVASQVGGVTLQLARAAVWQVMLHDRFACVVQLAPQVVWHWSEQLTEGGVTLHCSVQPEVHAAWHCVPHTVMSAAELHWVVQVSSQLVPQ